jgi:hypothetical protein
MAFPSNPTIGDLFTNGSKTFRWNGSVWTRYVETSTSYSNAKVRAYLGNVDGPLVPASDEGFSLGNETNKWSNLYLSGNTIYLGQTKIESFEEGILVIKSSNTQVSSAIAFSSNGYIAAPSGPLATASGAVSTSPKISNVQVTDSSYVVLDDTAANSGGYVSINGSNFDSGATVVIGSTSANSVTFVNSSKLNVALPSLSPGTYTVYVTNSDGGTALRINGLSISGSPTWTTAAGSIASAYESFPLTTTVNAVSDTAVVYSLLTGSLPTGANLNPGNGNIFVTSTALTNSNTTFNFTLNATDAELQNTSRAFSATVLTDGVRWVTSNVNEMIVAANGTSFSYTLNAISLSTRTLSYAANSLPNGITLSGNVLSGTFSSVSNVTTVATANTSTTNKSNFYNLCFVVYQTVQVQYLVVGGGAGAGWESGGGGGAGGFREGNLNLLPSTTYTVVLGGGGAGRSGSAGWGANGSPSCFDTITSAGGGGGGTWYDYPGRDGGSGGGGGTYGGSGFGCGNVPAVSPSQGNPGNTACSGPFGFNGGGGGGAGGQASPGSSGGGGPGGVGRYNLITGSNVAYAGGGGGGGWQPGGAGGAGGGGSGVTGSTAGGNGTVNTGGGGGGAGYPASSGGAGGSGIVILRIPCAYNATFGSVTATPANTLVTGFKIYCVTSGSGNVCFSAVPPYSVSASATNIDETGGNRTVTFTTTTLGLADGTTLYWTNSGTTGASDYTPGVTSGSLNIVNNANTITFTMTADGLAESQETFIFNVRTGSTSGTIVATSETVYVNNTSSGAL